jgi:ribosome-binding factor A
MPTDLKSVKVFVTFLGNESKKEEILETLRSEAKFLQGEVAHALKLRYCPRISFDWDCGYDNSLKIEKILHEIGSTIPPLNEEEN